MHKRSIVALYRMGFGVLILAAIVTQFMSSSQKMGFDPINFLSFFTIQSNILAAALFISLACIPPAHQQKQSTLYIRGAVTLYMSIVGIIYITLLANHPATLDTTLPWVNVVLHYIMPFVILIDWMVQPPQTKLRFSKALWWLVFPIAYLLYSLVRGNFTDWYPYPFINVAQHGYAQVLITSVVISVVVAASARLLLLFYKRVGIHKD